MAFSPIIKRELRLASRQSSTYWLRILGGLSVVIFLWYASLRTNGDPKTLGFELFRIFTPISIYGLAILAPILTADCLSSEKREGTIGLLFLTSLNSRQIVAAKGFVHGLRSLNILLAFAPLFCITFLMGGMNKTQVIMTVIGMFEVVMIGLSAGLLASAYTKVWGRSLTLAVILSAFFFSFWCAFNFSAHLLQMSKLNPFQLLTGMPFFEWFNYALTVGLVLPLQMSQNANASINWDSICFLVQNMAFSFLIIFISFILAANKIQKSWQDLPMPKWMQQIERIFCQPRFFRKFLDQRLDQKLRGNPIAWLHHYTISSRLVKWGWCLSVTILITLLSLQMFSNSLDLTFTGEICGMGILVLAIAISSAGSFQYVSKNGIMELILTTPLRVNQIIWGHFAALWNQFLPGIALLGIWTLIKFYYFIAYYRGDMILDSFQYIALQLLAGCCIFFALTMNGLWLSIQRHKLMTAVAINLAQVFLPFCFLNDYFMEWFLMKVMKYNPNFGYSMIHVSNMLKEIAMCMVLCIIFYELFFGWKTWRQLKQGLLNRKFAFE